MVDERNNFFKRYSLALWLCSHIPISGHKLEFRYLFESSLSVEVIRIACPEDLSPPETEVARANEAGTRVRVLRDPDQAVEGADCVVTDTWVSMNDEDPAGNLNRAARHNLLAPYQVNAALMARAKPDALFMHCLPAHRGEEVTEDVIDGPQSVVWDEAENRLHAQKGILTWCLA